MNEGLRLQPSTSSGLPRVVPAHAPCTIHGYTFPPGTVLSVPAYTIQRDVTTWGPDAEEFKPERWNTLTDVQKRAFIPFSHGPRGCIGRNLAEMEMKMIIACIFRRYSCETSIDEMESYEGFLRKPVACPVELQRR
jgi:benzoate 4-monooxygenase